jgi:hypothetical protein
MGKGARQVRENIKGTKDQPFLRMNQKSCGYRRQFMTKALRSPNPVVDSGHQK